MKRFYLKNLINFKRSLRYIKSLDAFIKNVVILKLTIICLTVLSNTYIGIKVRIELPDNWISFSTLLCGLAGVIAPSLRKNWNWKKLLIIETLCFILDISVILIYNFINIKYI